MIMKGIHIFYWLVTPDDMTQEGASYHINLDKISDTQWKVLNFTKGVFWYCVAVSIGLLVGSLY